MYTEWIDIKSFGTGTLIQSNDAQSEIMKESRDSLIQKYFSAIALSWSAERLVIPVFSTSKNSRITGTLILRSDRIYQ